MGGGQETSGGQRDHGGAGGHGHHRRHPRHHDQQHQGTIKYTKIASDTFTKYFQNILLKIITRWPT